jgi:hypothetical protein
MHRFRYCAALVAVFCIVNTAHAETIPFTGTLTVKEAEFTAIFPSDANAFELTPTSVSVSNNTPGLCSLSATKDTYNSATTIDCVVEWSTLPSSHVASGTAASGYYQNVGTESYEYTVSVFVDGSTDARVVSTGNFAVNVNPPPPSVVTSIVYTGSNGSGDLLQTQVFVTETDMPTLTLNVEPRGYDQQFTSSGSATYMTHSWSSCTVPAGTTSCSDNYAPSLQTEYGQETLQLDFQCGGECYTNFPSLASGASAIHEWDFRPPLSSEIAGQVRSGGAIELTPSVENLRIGETYTLSIVQPPSGATAGVSMDGQKVSFAHTTSASSTVNFRYLLETSQGRSVEPYGRISIVQDQTMPTFSMPSIPASEPGDIGYASSGSARYASGEKFAGVISGTLELLVSSSTGVRVSGTELTPGQSTPISLNFIDGVPGIALRFLSSFPTMTAEIVFLPADVALPRVKLPLNGYTVTAELELPETAVAGLQNVQGTLTSTCSISDEAQAMVSSNTCFAEFILPAGMTQTGDRRIEGIVGSGSNTIEYRVGFYSGGTRYWLASGSKTMTTSAPEFNYILFGAPIDRLDLRQNLSLIDSTEDPAFDCTYYEGEKVETTIATLNGGRIFCHVEWLNIPGGLETQSRSPNRLKGRLQSAADAVFYARITSLLPGGAELVIHDEPITPEIIEPVIPEFTLEADQPGANGEFGYMAGSTRIRASGSITMNGDVQLTSYLDGEDIGYTTPTFSGSVRDLAAPADLPVGQTATLTIRVAYRNAPDIYTEKEIKIVSVPASSIRPFAIDSGGFNDVDQASLSSAIRNMSWTCRSASSECPYDINTFGKWDIYLAKYMGYRDPPLRITDSYPTNIDGIAEIPYSLTTDRQRFVLVANFISDEGSLIDSRESPPVIYDVLKKSDFDGRVTSRTVSGEAPLSTGLRFTLDERSDMVHVRNVKWQVDEGTGWVTVSDTDGRRGLFLRRVFEEGVYQVRAIVTNPAGLDTYSESLTVEAYTLPTIELVGSTYLLPGVSEEFSLLIDGEPPSADEWIINWEMDAFDAFDTTSVTLSSDENSRTRMTYRAHLRRYPDDPRAGRVGTTTVIWDTPRYVRYRFDAPREVWDTGETYALSAEPYADRFGLTFRGEWTLPDGAIVPGTSISYTPDERGFGYKLLNFTGWYEEWPSVQGESRLKINHLSDLLPNIDLDHDYTSPIQAPAETYFRVSVDRRLSSAEFETIDTEIVINGGELTYDAGMQFGAVFTTGGAKTIKTAWTNADGDRVEGNATIEVLPPADLEMTLDLLSTPEYIVNSGSAWVMPSVTGLASNDRLTLYTGLLNGEPWPISGRFGKILYPIPEDPGTYELTLIADTKYGYTVQGTIQVTIP